MDFSSFSLFATISFDSLSRGDPFGDERSLTIKLFFLLTSFNMAVGLSKMIFGRRFAESGTFSHPSLKYSRLFFWLAKKSTNSPNSL